METEKQYPPFERVEVGSAVFYSIFSAYDKEVLHMDPEQLLDLQAWLNANESGIRQDVQAKGDR